MNNKVVKAKSNIAKCAFSIVRFVIIFGIGFIILKPIISKIFLSFMSPQDLLDNTVRLIPTGLSTHYWNIAIEKMDLINTFLNTFVLSITVAVIQTFSCTLVGYGLARFKFKGNGLAFAFVIIMMLVPYNVISIAQYQSFVNFSIGSFEIADTYIPLYILAFTGLSVKEGFYIYLLRESFKSLPISIEEAAYIDGAGVLKTFLQVMLPNGKTIITTVFLFSFCWQWTDQTYSTLYLKDTKVFANIMNDVIVRHGVHYDMLGTLSAQCAASLLIMVPLIGLFVFCQRSFVKSIAQAGLSNV